MSATRACADAVLYARIYSLGGRPPRAPTWPCDAAEWPRWTALMHIRALRPPQGQPEALADCVHEHRPLDASRRATLGSALADAKSRSFSQLFEASPRHQCWWKLQCSRHCSEVTRAAGTAAALSLLATTRHACQVETVLATVLASCHSRRIILMREDNPSRVGRRSWPLVSIRPPPPTAPTSRSRSAPAEQTSQKHQPWPPRHPPR